VDCTVFAPNKISLSQKLQTRRSLNISPDAFVFGFVGRLVNDKGINELSIAWKQVSAKIDNAVLIIIGPKNEPNDRISYETNSYLSNSKSIRLTGAVQNTVAYYSIMDTLVHPSHREGFPNAVLEAAAMELPVITTDALGCIDSVRDGETGFIVPVRNTEKLAEKMLLLARDTELRENMGKKARQRVLCDFDPQSLALELVHLLKKPTLG
jgi:glycosyltransferase involved in cell wall biosynthesis